jgi:hypothetical protein
VTCTVPARPARTRTLPNTDSFGADVTAETLPAARTVMSNWAVPLLRIFRRPIVNTLLGAPARPVSVALTVPASLDT